MAIKYLAGNRLIGTAAERAALLTTGQGYADFNGSSQSLVTPNVNDFDFMSDGSAFSLAFWVYRDGQQGGTEPAYIGNNGTSTSEVGFTFYDYDTSSSGNIGFFIGGGSTVSQGGTASKLPPSELRSSITDATWTHFVITYDASGDKMLRMYRDGTSVATYQVPTPFYFSTDAPDNNMAIGRNITRGFINARMADIGFWDGHVLSAGDIEKLKDGTRITDDGTGFDYSSSNIAHHLPLFANITDTKGSVSFTNNGSVSPTTTNSSTNPTIDDIPSNLPENTLFEESDTGKHYMFDDSSAWNEVA